MTIHVTLDPLNAFFDYTNPSHPWQVDRQLLPEDPFFFSMEVFDPLAPVSKRAPLETVFTAYGRVFVVIVPCQISALHFGSVGSGSSLPLLKRGSPFVPKTTDWLAEVTALVGRHPWRANWVYRPFDHPYSTTYVPCTREARIFCPRGVDAAMANQIARAIIANPCLQPPELIPDWQDRYLTGAVPGDSTAAASTVDSGVDDSSTSALPPAACLSSRNEEEKESSGDTSRGVLAEAARRLSSD
ncbi:hypothetical protein PPTG_13360 [Phytophthora nicotianae INRA-310]|uniref:Uncharacterized protein n=1 Tax=Phytophthora nicotianae (strain INRA-310) TaxID=761204 RepID=W2Q3M0_PHYN3|nr:hypothetical protein PPTG_13360 [Phytophthora nicotianae INRA-310]ETN07461.1 hypothetical protein PPTG_13360 [Phytophthora nicotianae INRA-310]